MSNKLIYGTAGKIDFKLLSSVCEKNLIFHTSYDYEGYNALKDFLFNKKKSKIIFKVKYKNLDDLKNLIEKYKNDFNLNNIYAIQISRNPNFFNDIVVLKFLEEQKKNNLISKIYFELYWDYSKQIKNKIENFIIDGYVFCYNLIEREVSNSVLKEIKLNNKEVISLRSFSGFNLSKKNKTFYHLSYLKFYLIKIYIIILKKIMMKNYLSICMMFAKSSKVDYSVFTTTKTKNFDEIIDTYDNMVYKKKYDFILKIIDVFHTFFWMFGGTNSSSAVQINTSAYYKIERKIFEFIKSKINK